MLLGLSEALPSLVGAKFNSAKASSSLLFSPTEVAIIRTSSGVPFQLRYCPSLAKKPTPNKDEGTPKKKIDPFDKPPPALHVTDIPGNKPSHLLVLNKFPIIAEHFILATKLNKRQTNVLERDDLEVTYACLEAWEAEQDSQQRRLYAFFNSGEHSGASQPHRHLQFLPLESMREGDATSGWDLLIDLILSSKNAKTTGKSTGLLHHPDLPFAHFAKLFTSEPSSSELLSIYNDLYQAASDEVSKFVAAHPEQLSLHPGDEGNSTFSYNLAMTTAGMCILPRRAEGTMLRREDGSEVGFVALNGTTLGGTMMVKYQEEWDLLRKWPEMLDHILLAIGIPRADLEYKSRV
ncbi:Ap4A phosphorylase-like protein II [Setomelanomma holmii]|uniref:Ap4A phosphorylase-like protein II n=1 Tax=Setomelanomma holmii TaxID=210430 RepID=A0A9P4HCN6_9PLEO|nr:Ap4A phosphorylase-like protein II [Setomelanomma holmii]